MGICGYGGMGWGLWGYGDKGIWGYWEMDIWIYGYMVIWVYGATVHLEIWGISELTCSFVGLPEHDQESCCGLCELFQLLPVVLKPDLDRICLRVDRVANLMAVGQGGGGWKRSWGGLRWQ